VSPSRDEKPQFGQILTFQGLLYPAPFTNDGQFGLLEQAHGVCLHD